MSHFYNSPGTGACDAVVLPKVKDENTERAPFYIQYFPYILSPRVKFMEMFVQVD